MNSLLSTKNFFYTHTNPPRLAWKFHLFSPCPSPTQRSLFSLNKAPFQFPLWIFLWKWWRVKFWEALAKMHKTQRSLTRGLVSTKILILSSFYIPSICSLPPTTSTSCNYITAPPTTHTTTTTDSKEIIRIPDSSLSCASASSSVFSAANSESKFSYLTKIISLLPVAQKERKQKEGEDDDDDIICIRATEEEARETDDVFTSNNIKCNINSLIFSR